MNLVQSCLQGGFKTWDWGGDMWWKLHQWALQMLLNFSLKYNCSLLCKDSCKFIQASLLVSPIRAFASHTQTWQASTTRKLKAVPESSDTVFSLTTLGISCCWKIKSQFQMLFKHWDVSHLDLHSESMDLPSSDTYLLVVTYFNRAIKIVSSFVSEVSAPVNCILCICQVRNL